MNAYPFQHKDPTTGLTTISEGMTLRDYFAAKAMQSLMWDKDLNLDNRADVAEVAYAYADEMLEARNVNN
jgi:hypothetical protein